ncbi:hypothetical protein ACFL1A_01240 [Patescibacteria group bacterium]
MDFTKQGIVYVLLVIPTLYAVAVLGQGINKMTKNEPDFAVPLGFGIFLLLLIFAAYFLFIR